METHTQPPNQKTYNQLTRIVEDTEGIGSDQAIAIV